MIQMTGFRSLGDEEEVEFDCKESDKGLEATIVTGPQNQDCKGSHRRPMCKKRFRKIRYSLGLGNDFASELGLCLGRTNWVGKRLGEETKNVPNPICD